MVLPLFKTRWLRRSATNTGRQGEYLAVRFLRRHGYKVLARNLRTRHGEIDVVVMSPDRSTLVIVEVKTAREPDLLPELRVDHKKHRRLADLGVQVARLCRRTDLPIRYDILGVNLPANGKISIRHHRGEWQLS